MRGTRQAGHAVLPSDGFSIWAQCVYFRLKAFARNSILPDATAVFGECLPYQILVRLSASPECLGRTFAEFGAIDAGHPAQMREPQIECNVDDPLTRLRI